MAYFPDLSSFSYHRSGIDKGFLNVGWLSSDYEFNRSSPVENPRHSRFLDNLALYVERPVIVHRGIHACDFCGIGFDSVPCETHQGRELRLGYAVSAALGEGNQVFVFPTLIFHYVVAHNYQPPDEFIQAVLTQPLPNTPEFLARLRSVSPRWAHEFIEWKSIRHLD